MSDMVPSPPMAVTGAVRGLLRAEGLAELAVALTLYGKFGGSWWLFAALFLVPDISFFGYLAGARAGAVAYNAMHATLGPALLGLLAWAGGSALGVSLALIWAAHVGFDRMLGYGLKYGSGFGDTHLGRIGRAA